MMRALNICRSGRPDAAPRRGRALGRRIAAIGRIALFGGAAAGALCVVAPASVHASSAWLPEPRQILARAKYLHSETNEAFCPVLGVADEARPCEPGDRARYPFEGDSRVRSGLFEIEAGLPRRFALDAALSYLHLEFDDILTRRRTRGLGDLRLGARFALARGGLPVAPFVAVKIPLGDAPSVPQALPLGEMQRDVEAGLYAGASLWPRPAFLAASCGYRIRAENRDTRRDPGDEVFASFEAGIRAGRFLAKGGVSGVWGDETIERTAAAAAVEAGKRVAQISAGALFDFSTRAALDAAVYIPVAGRNYPAGVTLVAGLSVRLDV